MTEIYICCKGEGGQEEGIYIKTHTKAPLHFLKLS